MSKDRTDCWETSLTEEQQQLAFEAMRDLGGPKARVVLLKDERFDGVAVPGTSTLYRFFDRYRRVVDEDRLRRAVAAKVTIEQTCDAVGDVDDALKKALAFQGLEAVASGEPEQIKNIICMYNDLLRRQVSEGELQLKREKFEDVLSRNALAREKLNAVASSGGISRKTVEQIEEALDLL